VPVSGHSAKRSLSSAESEALGKVYFLIKKNLCRVSAIWHSAKTVSLAVNRAPPHSFLSLSQSHHSHPPLAARRLTARATRPLPCRHSHAAPTLPAIARCPDAASPRAPPDRCRAARRRHSHAALPLPAILRPPRPSPPSSRRPSPPSLRRHGRRPPRAPSSGKSCNNPSFSIVIANLCSLW
jgi:hypothetical protein